MPRGLYLALVIDRMRGGRFMASVVRTLQEVFPYVYVLSDVPGTRIPQARTYVVAASETALDVDRLRRPPGEDRTERPRSASCPRTRWPSGCGRPIR